LKAASGLLLAGTTTSPQLQRISISNGSGLLLTDVQEAAFSASTVRNITIDNFSNVQFTNLTAGANVFCRHSRIGEGSTVTISNKTVTGGLDRSSITCGGSLVVSGAYGLVANASIMHGQVIADGAGGSVTRLRKSLTGTLTLGAFIHTDIVHESSNATTLTTANINRATLSAVGPLV